MNLLRSVRSVANASGDGPVDWTAAGEAAKAATSPGTLDLTEREQQGYADDVRDARDRVRSVGGVEFDLPNQIEIQNRHHWIDANVDTFRRVMEPLAERQPRVIPGAARVLNTGSTTVALSFLASHVLGQYDPVLLADPDDEHALYFVHPNIVRIADELDTDLDRFRRWIAFHEVAHAAEFGAAPWLTDHLETRVERAIDALTRGELDREAFREVDVAMTAIEGYAELIMDRTFDQRYDDLRDKLEERRRGGDPFTRLMRRLLGLGMKRRQYERGKAFFDTIADARGVEAAAAVWEAPENLPTNHELDDPRAWLFRVDP